MVRDTVGRNVASLDLVTRSHTHARFPRSFACGVVSYLLLPSSTFINLLQPDQRRVYLFATFSCLIPAENAGALMPGPELGDFRFLFGENLAVTSGNPPLTPLTTRRSAHSHHPPPQYSSSFPSLNLALQDSARSSLDSHRSSLLHEASPISFAPIMSAPPAGYS